ncbi:MAG: hypothetical protein ACOY5Y_05600 [Pseudomonadota bacterium]
MFKQSRLTLLLSKKRRAVLAAVLSGSDGDDDRDDGQEQIESRDAPTLGESKEFAIFVSGLSGPTRYCRLSGDPEPFQFFHRGGSK